MRNSPQSTEEDREGVYAHESVQRRVDHRHPAAGRGRGEGRGRLSRAGHQLGDLSLGTYYRWKAQYGGMEVSRRSASSNGCASWKTRIGASSRSWRTSRSITGRSRMSRQKTGDAHRPTGGGGPSAADVWDVAAASVSASRCASAHHPLRAAPRIRREEGPRAAAFPGGRATPLGLSTAARALEAGGGDDQSLKLTRISGENIVRGQSVLW